MKLLYSASNGKFPTRDFEAGKDLNSNPEYPYSPEKGMWLSPAIETKDGLTSPWIIDQAKKFGKASKNPKRVYTLQDDANLYHIRSLSDYTFAYGMFPLFMKEHKYIYDQYVEKSEYMAKKIAQWMDIYNTFKTWKTELCEKTGISDIGLNSNVLNKPLHFTDSHNNIIDLRVVIDSNGMFDFKNTDLEYITGYIRQKKSYNNKDAIILLKQICDYIIRYIKKISRTIKPSPEDTIIGIDYNVMRDAGYTGIYIHRTAVEEARKVPVENPLYEIIDPLLYWSAETICVWSYCFTD